MKSLFIVGAKLLGIWFLYESLIVILFASPFLINPEEEGGLSHLLITYTPMFLPSLVIGIFLVSKTDWLAGLVGSKGDDANSDLSLDQRTLLSVGIRLIGLFLFFSQISALFTTTYAWIKNFQLETLDRNILFSFRTMSYFVPLYLIFGWRRIIDILDRPAKVGREQADSAET